MLRGVLPLLLIAVWVSWSVHELRLIAQLDGALRSVGEITADTRFDPDWARQQAILLKRQLDRRPDDGEAQIRYAEFLLAAHRSDLFRQLQAEGASDNNAESLWNLADMMSLHRKFYEPTQHDEFLTALRENSAYTTYLRPAYESLCTAIRHGPILASAHTLLAKISFACEPSPQELEYAERSLQLRGHQPATLFQLGLLDISAGRVELGLDRWRKCLALTRKFDHTIVSVCLSRMTMADFITQILPASPLRAVALAERIGGDSGITSQQAALADAIAALDEKDLSEAERAYVAATIHRLRGQLDAARSDYQTAVELEPARTDWRFELANLLAEQESLADALEQAAICARLDPSNRRVTTFLEQLKQRVTGAR